MTSRPRPAEVDWSRVERFLVFCWRLALVQNGSITGGCRTEERNAGLKPPGHPESRHLFETGWGAACDFVFDTSLDRDIAMREVTAEGYHPYVGEGYGTHRLHVQMVRPGVKLENIETGG